MVQAQITFRQTILLSMDKQTETVILWSLLVYRDVGGWEMDSIQGRSQKFFIPRQITKIACEVGAKF